MQVSWVAWYYDDLPAMSFDELSIFGRFGLAGVRRSQDRCPECVRRLDEERVGASNGLDDRAIAPDPFERFVERNAGCRRVCPRSDRIDRK